MAAMKSGVAISGGTRMAYSMGKAASSSGGVKGAAAGIGAVASAGMGSARASLSRMSEPVRRSFQSGGRSAVTSTGGKISGGSETTDAASSKAPDWARRAKGSAMGHHTQIAASQALRDTNSAGAGANPSLKQDEE